MVIYFLHTLHGEKKVSAEEWPLGIDCELLGKTILTNHFLKILERNLRIPCMQA